MNIANYLFSILIAVCITATATTSNAQEVFKIGLILPLTGPFASSIGRHVEAGAKLYIEQNSAIIAGRRIELILKDDGGVADSTKRLAQELIVNDKVDALAGFGLTPLALAVAPIATQAKIPQIVMAAGTSIITEQSPYIVRTSFTLAQNTVPLADWAAKQGIKRVATLVSDYGPGLDAEKAFKERFAKAGGEVILELRTPLKTPEFAPFLQKIIDTKPEAVFLFVPSGQGAQLLKQVAERDFAKAGIRVIATGDVTDDNDLNEIGDVALGMVTSHHYSAAHNSPENMRFVTAFKAANQGRRPNLMSIGGYDGMALIYQALTKTGGKSKTGDQSNGEALVEAMKGIAWLSPRGPVQIDPQTRDIIQTVYLRKVERVNGELYNIEFDKVDAVKDPVKAAK